MINNCLKAKGKTQLKIISFEYEKHGYLNNTGLPTRDETVKTTQNYKIQRFKA